jgi:thiamine biosynthesis lipoprotein
MKKFNFLALSLILLMFILNGCENRRLYQNKQVLMGTFVEVISSDPRAANIAFAEIRRIESILSKYRENSELSQLNKNAKMAVSPELFFILNKSYDFWKKSDGAFDVTIGPLMDIWGFTNKDYRLPNTQEIKKTLRAVGMNKIIFTNKDNVVKFKIREMKLDLGAIAKGYAVDLAVNKLKEAGIKSALVNAGGQIYCLGDKFGKPWKVAVRHPRKKGLLITLELKNQAVATSGDYEQYFEIKDRRYAHILNPKTGYPAESGVISVTVIAPEGLTADALSTAIFVLGKEKGKKLAEKFPGVKIKIVEKNE